MQSRLQIHIKLTTTAGLRQSELYVKIIITVVIDERKPVSSVRDLTNASYVKWVIFSF